MKKIFPSLVLLTVLASAIAPVVASAQQTMAEQCTISQTNITRIQNLTGVACTATCPFTNTDCGMCCLMSTIYRITDWIFFIVIALVVIFVLIGAFMFVTAGGSAEKTLSARNYLIYAAIGMLVALLAKAIPVIVKSLTGL